MVESCNRTTGGIGLIESSFYDWLISKKELSNFAAKDVISRCNRVCRIIDVDNLEKDSLEILNSNNDFSTYSKFVRSQLRRAVNLFLEFKEDK